MLQPIATMRCVLLLAILASALLAATATSAHAWPPRFDGGFEAGTKVPPWWLDQSCSAGIQPYSNAAKPAGAPNAADGSWAAKYSVTAADAFPNCAASSGNPRAQLLTGTTGEWSLPENTVRHIGWRVFVPSVANGGPPLVDTSQGKWLVLGQIFGAPFSGSPPVSLQIKKIGSSNHLTVEVCNLGCGATTTIWSTPVTEGSWQRVSLRIWFSTSGTSPLGGWVIPYYGGLQSGQRTYTQTMHPGHTTNYSFYESLYLSRSLASAAPSGRITVYHDAARIGDMASDM